MNSSKSSGYISLTPIYPTGSERRSFNSPPQQRTAEDITVRAFVHKEFDRRNDLGTLLYLVEKTSVSPLISGTEVRADKRSSISPLLFAPLNSSTASGISMKLISTKLLNDLPN